MLDVVKNKCYDAGTCLPLYWINDSYYYQEYVTISEYPYKEEREMLRILRTVERRLKRADFRTTKVLFDPAVWIEDKYLASAVHQMPNVMRAQVGPPLVG